MQDKNKRMIVFETTIGLATETAIKEEVREFNKKKAIDLYKDALSSTSSITAKIEAADRMAEALPKMMKRAAYAKGVDYASYNEEMNEAQKSLAHWRTVNGAAKERGG